MARSTTNLGLVKPEPSDRYTPDVFNQNLQKIDDHFGLLGSSMGNSVSNDLGALIGGENANFSMKAVWTRRMGRLGGLRLTFRNKKELVITTNGRLQGAAYLLGSVIREMHPVGPVALGSVNLGYYHCEGLLEPDGNIYLSHIGVQEGNLRVAPDQQFQLTSDFYILKGNL